MVALGLLACVLFGFALVSRRIEGSIVTAPMRFVSAGLVAGWTGLVEFGAAAHGGSVPFLTLFAHGSAPRRSPGVTAGIGRRVHARTLACVPACARRERP